MSPSALFQVDDLVPAAPAGGWPGGLSLRMSAGERLAIVGPAGAGKSALLRAAALLTPPAAGRVWFAGADLTRLRPDALRAVRRRLPYIGGDPVRGFPPNVTVAQALLEPLEIHRLGTAAERQARLTEAAGGLRLNLALLARPLRTLSAGLRQRVAVARGLVLQPELLITDGIGDVLEPAAAGPLLELVSEWCRTHGLAWLWSTRQDDLAVRFADRALRLESGRLLPA